MGFDSTESFTESFTFENENNIIFSDNFTKKGVFIPQISSCYFVFQFKIKSL